MIYHIYTIDLKMARESDRFKGGKKSPFTSLAIPDSYRISLIHKNEIILHASCLVEYNNT